MTGHAGGDPLDRLLEDSAEDLYENAPCGYLSTLPDGTIARANTTFLRLTGYRREELIGRRRFQSLLPVGDRVFYETHYAPLVRMQQGAREIAVEVTCADGTRLPVLLNTTVTTDADGAIAYLRTTVFDARQRREYERELLRARRRAEESEARATELARTLQESFLPPDTPAVPGVDIGAAFRPAGSGDEIGGDFYDVFDVGDGEWVAVLGDVQGKGVKAARVTALARHSLRAAAMANRAPSAVLSTLNEALRRSTESRFCTVLYVRLRLTGEGAPHLTIAAAGHAPPVLVTPDGSADPLDIEGDLVGVLQTPSFPEVELTLRPGEALCLVTDGVTEGRAGGDYFGDQRLLDLLAEHRRQPAEAIAHRVVDEVVAFQDGRPRDDIAVLVLRAPTGAG